MVKFIMNLTGYILQSLTKETLMRLLRANKCKFTEILHKNTKVHKTQVKITGKTLSYGPF